MWHYITKKWLSLRLWALTLFCSATLMALILIVSRWDDCISLNGLILVAESVHANFLPWPIQTDGDFSFCCCERTSVHSCSALEFLESNFSSHCTILLRIKEICSCGKSSFSGSSAHELWQVAGCCCWGAPTSGWFFKGFFKGDTWGRSSFNSRSRSGRTTGKGSHSGMLYGKDWIEKLWTRSRSSSNPNPSFSVVSEI